jgi:hypothetical protein
MTNAHQCMQELTELASNGLGNVQPQSLSKVTDLYF